jgi:hypothetical protein
MPRSHVPATRRENAIRGPTRLDHSEL